MFSSPGYDALLRGAALVRRTDRGVVQIGGADRASWLQGLVTNDVSALAPGQRVYSAYLTPQGRMITDVWVLPTADALLLDVPASLAPSLATRFDGLVFAEDVQIDDRSAKMAVLQVFGNMRPAFQGAAVAHDPTYGVPSFVVYLDASDMDAFRATFHPPVPEVGLEALEVLRIEAGVPRFLTDMSEDTIPLEAGIEDRAISFTKGCYVGQEIIVRITTRGGGRVARKLVGLTFEAGAPVPPAGRPILSGDRGVGRLTSAVFSPRCSAVIALGYVHRDVTEPGTRLSVDADSQRLAVSVHALPFVSPVA